jgi:serine/threonine protein kinase
MKLNQYQWEPETDLIGEGAFGQVFKASDNMGEPFALKIYAQPVFKSTGGDSAGSKHTLEKEFSKGKDLSHTNVIRYICMDYLVHVNHLNQEASFPVLVMEYANQGTLEHRLEIAYPAGNATGYATEPLGNQEVQTIAKEILSGLAYLHDQYVIHRDLKPANILFGTDRRGHKVVKITDFGISRDLLDPEATSTGTLAVGTANYMAPEQFLTKTFGLNAAISNRTDLWAFGVILYRMLTGKLPFGTEGYEETRSQIIEGEPDYTLVPEKYKAVIKGCLQKYAANRFADAETVIKVLNDEAPKKESFDPNATTVLNNNAQQKASFDPNATTVLSNTPQQPSNNQYAGNNNHPGNNQYSGNNQQHVNNPFQAKQSNTGPQQNTRGFADNLKQQQKKFPAAAIAIIAFIVGGLLVLGYAKFHNSNSAPEFVTAKFITSHDTAKGQPITYTYTGWMKDDEPNGEGTKMFKNGDKYAGSSVSGYSEGKGRLDYAAGGSYEGDFQKDLSNGSGIYIDASGNKYEGQFVNGFEEGNGMMNYNQDNNYKGDKYVGEWKKGLYTKGIYYWHNGNVYTGEWQQDKMDGEGSLVYYDGSKYIGQWKAGNYDGYGKIYGKDGNLIYEGQFQNGQRITQ